MVAYINVKLPPELHALVAQEADRSGPPVPMNELLVQILAERYSRPDLAFVPRKRMGRPRKDQVAAGR